MQQRKYHRLPLSGLNASVYKASNKVGQVWDGIGNLCQEHCSCSVLIMKNRVKFCSPLCLEDNQKKLVCFLGLEDNQMKLVCFLRFENNDNKLRFDDKHAKLVRFSQLGCALASEFSGLPVFATSSSASNFQVGLKVQCPTTQVALKVVVLNLRSN